MVFFLLQEKLRCRDPVFSPCLSTFFYTSGSNALSFTLQNICTFCFSSLACLVLGDWANSGQDERGRRGAGKRAQGSINQKFDLLFKQVSPLLFNTHTISHMQKIVPFTVSRIKKREEEQDYLEKALKRDEFGKRQGFLKKNRSDPFCVSFLTFPGVLIEKVVRRRLQSS